MRAVKPYVITKSFRDRRRRRIQNVSILLVCLVLGWGIYDKAKDYLKGSAEREESPKPQSQPLPQESKPDAKYTFKPPREVLPPARKEMKAKIIANGAVLRSNYYTQAPSIGSLSQNDKITILDKWNPSKPDAVVVTSQVTLVTSSGSIRLGEGAIVYVLAEKGTTYVVSYKRGNKEVTGEVPAEAVAAVGTETWYKVRTQAGKEGWISSKFIELIKE